MNQLPALGSVLLSGVLAACQAERAESPSDMVAAGGSSAGTTSSGSSSGATVSGGEGSSVAGAAPAGGTGGGGGAAGDMSQAGKGGGIGGGGTGTGGSAELPPIEECASKPSVDRFTEWVASGEGTTVPATGSILTKLGEEYVGKVELVGAGWHVIPVYLKNKFGEALDLSTANGITLTYSATAELHVQLRSKSHWSGGNQYATTIPATNGTKQTMFFSFAEMNWKSLFGAPTLSYPDTLKEGMGLVFVGDGENSVVFYGLRIDGYVPPCP